MGNWEHCSSLLCLVSPQVAPAHSSSIIPVTMVTGSELSQTLMVQLPSQNESKKPRVGQLRETQAESSSSYVESFCTLYTHHTLSHTTPHTLHILLTPSHIHLTLKHVRVPYMYAFPTLILMCTQTLVRTNHTLSHTPHTYPHMYTSHTHTPSQRSPSHEATQGAQGMALPSWRDASLSCAPHTRAKGGAGGSLRQSYHVQELQEGGTA